MEHEIFLAMREWGKTKSCKVEMKTPSFGSIPPPPKITIPTRNPRKKNSVMSRKEYTPTT